MKKVTKKLSLNKQTVASLDNAQMDNVKGGFTYTLSLGERCKISKELTATNPYDCGVMVSQIACPKEIDLIG